MFLQRNISARIIIFKCVVRKCYIHLFCYPENMDPSKHISQYRSFVYLNYRKGELLSVEVGPTVPSMLIFFTHVAPVNGLV